MEDIETLSNSLTKALAYAENGGAPDLNNLKAGKTGEMKSIYQFTPATWKKYAKDILGDENTPLNHDNESYVVNEKVKGWIKQGKTARQIASMWNAGPGEPDAYTGKFSDGSPSVGVNRKYGVRYDVPGYANKVLKYSKEFYMTKKGQINTTQGSNENKDALNSVISTIQKASQKTPNTPYIAPNNSQQSNST